MASPSAPGPAKPDKSAGRADWPELDLLRGLAVVIMVLNHTISAWYSTRWAEDAVATALLQIGGFAPVLFFFATGFGTGLQRGRSRDLQHSFGLSRKVLILLLADQLMHWRWERAITPGLDFLGFIAVSMLALEPLRRARRPLPLAVGLAAAVVFVRFVLSPLLVPEIPDSDAIIGTAGWTAALTGRIALKGLSYPLFPWLFYPFAGFALGFVAQRARDTAGVPWLRVAAATAALTGVCAGGAALLVDSGMELNRYGLMSAAYFPLSLAALGVSLLVTIALRPALGRSRLLGWLSLRGVSSLAAVPLHLYMIRLLAIYARPEMVPSDFLPVILAVVVATLAAAHAFGAAIPPLLRRAPAWPTWIALGATTAACAWVLVQPGEVEIYLLAALPPLGQLCLCALLVAPVPAAFSSSGVAARREA